MEPIDILVRELRKSNGQLNKLRQKLGITKPDVSVEPLSRKKPAATFKLTETKTGWFVYYPVSWVVKFSPVDKQDDPWYDVYKEYDLLRALRRPPAAVPAPDPLHCSTEEERRVVGTKFIIMSFVEGKSFEDAKCIPEQYRERAFTSVMRTLAKNVHYYHWVTGANQDYHEHTQSETFWTKQETVWKRNYDEAAARTEYHHHGYHSHQSKAETFFKQMSSAVRPLHTNTRVIHGDMNISNVIFDTDEQNKFKVKAIVDWKSFDNGDPMVDVAYLCLTFMTPGDYGYQFRALNNHPLLLGNIENMESEVLEVYKKHYISFDEKVFNYAKAVCCQRWLSILQAAKADNFVGHESGEYEDNTDHTQLVMDCLATAGESFYDQSTS